MNGAVQVVRGVANTPQAIHQGMVEGKEWDKETRQWKVKIPYDLTKEAEEVLNRADEDDAADNAGMNTSLHAHHLSF